MKKFTKLWRSLLLISFIWAAISVSGQVVNQNNSRQKSFRLSEKEMKVEKIKEQKALQEKEKKIATLKAIESQNQGLDLSAYEDLSGEALEMKITELKQNPMFNKAQQKGGDATDLVSAFTFSQSTGTFTPISGGTVLATDTWDDDLFTATPIGFTFNFDGTPFTDLTISANGYLIFGGTTTLGFTPLSSTTAATGCVSAMGRDLEASDAVAGSTITYQLSGTSPNQVFTVEWLDAQRFGSSYDGELLDFQIILYEGTDVIEIVYGPITGSSYATPTHPQVGLRGASNTDFTVRETTTDWSATVSGANNTDKCTLTDLIFPADGLTFAFEAPANPPPGLPGSPVPADGAGDVAFSGNLEWTFGSDTDTYDLFFGEAGSMSQVVTGDPAGATGTWAYGPLAAATTYEWQVVAHNAYGSTNGPVWSFTTACAVYTPAYLQDFETWFPVCWEQAGSGTPTTGPADFGSSLWYQNDFGNAGPSLAATINLWSTGKEEWLISPSFDLTGGGFEITFDLALTQYFATTPGNLGSDDEVQLLSSIDGGTTWVLLQTWDATSTISNTGELVTVDVTSYTQSDVVFAFWATEGIVNDPEDMEFFIDNFSVDVPPACPEPLNLAIDNITTTGADFSWEPQSTETTWYVEVGLPGFTPGTGAAEETYTKTVSGEPPATIVQAISNLISATQYEAYVQADCGTDAVSDWAGPAAFTTACEAITAFPYTEGFEDPSFPPLCWDNDTWVQSLYGAPHTGAEFAYSNLAGSNLTSPEFDLADNYTLNYWYRAESASFPQDFDVLLSTDGTTFGTTLASYTGVTSTTYINEFINLDAYNGQTVWIRFVGLTGTGGFDYGVLLDDVTIDLTPDCPDPTNLGVANNIGGMIDLTWTSGSGQSNVEWGVSPYTLGTNPAVPAAGGMLNIGPLTTGETYDFYVQDDCTGSTSNWVGPFTFTYYPAPPNDLCSNAQPISGPYPVTGITGTTLGANEDCPVFLPVESGYVWYAIDLPYAFNFIEMDIFGDGLLDNGWIVGTDVECSCDVNDYYFATSYVFAPPNVTDMIWEAVPGPGTFYYPMATGSVQEGFTFDVNVTGPPVANAGPPSLTATVVENGNTTSHLIVGNTGDWPLDYTAEVMYAGGGDVTATPMPAANWTGSTDGTTITDNSLVSAFNTEHGWMMFDVSGIPDGATILNIEFNGYVNNTNWPYWAITQVTSDPLTATPADLYNDIDLGPDYDYFAEPSTFPTGWKVADLTGTAKADLEAALGQDWFVLGIRTDDYSPSYYIEFDGWNEANSPFLVVTYTTGVIGWLDVNGAEIFTSTILAGDPSDDILVGYDATGIPPDVYNATIEVNSNDPVTPNISIPVELTVEAGIAAELTVLLEGPYDAAGVMLQDLNTGGYIPLGQPYNPALPYYGNAAPEWLYAGSESVGAVPADVVDWVMVQVRDAVDAISATSATIEAEQAAFVKTDGSIVGLDGMSRLGFPGVTIDNDLFMVVYHRNHLGIMSGNAVTNVGGFYDYDFSTGETQVYGGANGHKDLGDGSWGMIAADGDGNGLVQNTDETGPWKTDLGSSGYLGGDFDMNGLGQNTDETDLWKPNLGGGGQVPAKSSDTGYQSQIPK